MGLLGDILGGGAKGLLDGIGGIIDGVTTTDEERAKARLEAQALVMQANAEVEATIRKELEAKERILVAELAQDDSYTKRARPSIVYAGLLIAVGSAVAKLMGSDVDVSQLVPTEFWLAWGGVTGTWVVGRTLEKRGTGNRFSRAVTGNRLLD